MKIHFSEEWIKKHILEGEDEPGGLMAISPELYRKMIEANHAAVNPQTILNAFNDDMKEMHEKVRSCILGKKYKIINDHVEFKNKLSVNLQNTIHTVREVSWHSLTGFAIVGEDHLVFVNIKNVEFIEE